ncbi:MAG: hypothetical protein Q7U57_07315 [Methylovulum sp.]|nr:hypothetical protein [Methylovulum sp.]
MVTLLVPTLAPPLLFSVVYPAFSFAGGKVIMISASENAITHYVAMNIDRDFDINSYTLIIALFFILISLIVIVFIPGDWILAPIVIYRQ